MTPEDAKEWLRSLRKAIGQPEHRSLWHFEQAIDEINKLLEKQIPKKPIEFKNDKDLKIGASIWRAGVPVYKCPHCENFISYSSKYCSECGQAIDRSK